jgi:hypothetical protein
VYVPYQLTFPRTGPGGKAELTGPVDPRTGEYDYCEWELDTGDEQQVLQVLMEAQEQVASFDERARVLEPQTAILPGRHGHYGVIIIWAEQLMEPFRVFESDLTPRAASAARERRSKRK